MDLPIFLCEEMEDADEEGQEDPEEGSLDFGGAGENIPLKEKPNISTTGKSKVDCSNLTSAFPQERWSRNVW